jgi:type III secretion protein C
VINKNLQTRRSCTLAATVLALSLAAFSTTPQAGPVPWPEAAFSYYAEGQPLSKVLGDFAASFNLTLANSAPLTDKVTGRFNVKNPTEFIERITGVYGLQWFTHAGVLHISRSQDQLVKSIPSTSLSAGANIRQVLASLGVLEQRFGWGELPEQGVVVVSGPPTYVKLLEATLAAMPSAPGGQQVSVFRLKHASVEDRVIAYRDREITTPGVANILRNLVLGAMATSGQRTVAMPNLSAVSNSNMENSAVGLANKSPAAASGTTQQGAGAASRGGTPGNESTSSGPGAASNVSVNPVGRSRPSIQADPRINAIIVQDAPERMAMYKELIAQLDVPTPLIEIEALIIDVNTSKLEELGINWGATARNRSIAVGFGDVSATVGANTLSVVGSARGSGVTPSTMLVAGADYLVARLRLLEQQGDAAIQARPSILTTENLGAVIDLSETQYIQTTSERTALVTPITAGTTLRVTPRVINDGTGSGIRLSVDIEDGQIQSGTSVGGMPSVRRGTVSTEASVKEDESLLIGGYNSIQTSKGTDKVPFLGDVPFFRGLFSSQSNKVQRRERLFLIRSSLASSNSPMAVRAIPPNQLDVPAQAPNVAKP